MTGVIEQDLDDVRRTIYKQRIFARLLLLGLMALTSGCSFLASLSTPEPVEPVVEPQLPPDLKPVPPPIVEADPAPPPEPVVDAEPAPAAEPDTLRVAVLLSGRSAAYENVANALAAQLDGVDIYDLSDRSLTPKETYDSILSSGTELVVAIGIKATALARSFEEVPVVFSQVFNVGEIGVSTDNVRGVSVLPPLDLQIAAWRELNPNLSSIGAIIGTGHERLIDEATRSAETGGVRFQYRLAQSDRETLYLFTRLVPDIDGFWLFPDNRILSASVLRQMLAYANRHRVQVAVFNDSLLALGATISTTSVDEDIAETIVAVANKLLEEGGIAVPAVTPLNKIQIRTNTKGLEQVASDTRDVSEGAR